MIEMLSYDFMQRALLAAVVVGTISPLIGVFLVQRRLALLGDGMGHVALTGVGLAFLVGTAPVPTALVLAAIGAVVLEIIRSRSRTAGDLALALVFYGGIAGGVFFTSINQYLFGSLSTVATGDLVGLVIAAVAVITTLGIFGRQIFLLALDPDLAHTQGIRTSRVSMLLTVLAAVTVVVGMRTVGLLLISAIMIVPIAAAQQLSRSFRATALLGVVLGLASCVAGLTVSFNLDVPPGPTIVFIALGLFAMCAALGLIVRRTWHRRERVSETATAGS